MFDRQPPETDRRSVGVVNARPKPVPPALPPRHVIDEYTHRIQFVRCVCGWTGSSAGDRSGPSDWSRHVAESRAGKP
jgi:hypothetical protein